MKVDERNKITTKKNKNNDDELSILTKIRIDNDMFKKVFLTTKSFFCLTIIVKNDDLLISTILIKNNNLSKNNDLSISINIEIVENDNLSILIKIEFV